MSRNWLWNKNDDQKVISWTFKVSEEALLAGNTVLASEILKGASNFFALRDLCMPLGGNSKLVSMWLWDMHSGIYEGTANISDLNIEPINTHRSVSHYFKLLNSFFDLNDLHSACQKAGEPILDLILPESYEGDGN